MSARPSRHLASMPFQRSIFIVLIVIAALSQIILFRNSMSYLTTKNDQEDQMFFAPGHSRFQMANVESNGFFTDIDQADWERLKERIRSQKNHNNEHTASGAVTDPAIFYQFSYEPSFTCLGEARIGGMGDGPKWVCDPHRIGTTSQDHAHQPKPSCLVYSVGCAGKVEFEKGIHDHFGSACEMHVFDVTGYNRRNGNFTEIVRDAGGIFHQWGIGTAEQSASNPAKFKTLKETVETLGHNGRKIDIFKIDCEGCEWTTYKDWFDADVEMIRQILVEVHSVKVPETFDFFRHLAQLGYVIFHKEANVLAKPFGDAWEYAFIKLGINSGGDVR